MSHLKTLFLDLRFDFFWKLIELKKLRTLNLEINF